ncbi:MAG: preprotein translocase subunit SecA [Candidatus Magasanikbacteria bacterium]|jgi:preprotein translocase subunit SecA|nr:preprotein translocase subunit SecA [Candidatus Magasanikbacteria bacterium]
MNAIKKAYESVFGSPHLKTMKGLEPIVKQVNDLEDTFAALSTDALKGKTAEFKARLEKGESLDDLLPEAFATVRETGKRLMKMRHYDVQITGGVALHKGTIAEMRTGEGKTLVATLPTYLNALEGKGVHVITVNDYLAKRDAVWMAQIYDFLGLSVGIVQNQRKSYIYDASFDGAEEGGEIDKERDDTGSYKVENEFLRPASRQEVYMCDITYGTNNEFGFDYLRDNMVQGVDTMVMRPGHEMHYAVIDEIDSILIDEARTPLIISAPADAAADQYQVFAKIVKGLKEDEHYNKDEKMRSATLTDEGIDIVEQSLGIKNIYADGGIQMVHHIEQALRAEVLFQRDKEYVVDGSEITIIDEFTGRKMPGRRYSQGLHQAIEAKEGVKVQQESRTLATITFQNLFRMYTKLSGMTGTAYTEEEEFRTIYGLEVLVIPTNKPDARIDHEDRIYRNEKGKYKAILKKVQECQEKGQPILIGTISVEKNEYLSQYLSAHGIKHELLNAKNHEREGEVIASAGTPGAVTLATNMAGRGVDIKLGGTDESLKEKVMASGGLFVLGTERHESRRIDNQLRGRSARQGDTGETQFFVSTNDDLMRIFAGERLRSIMERLKVPEDMPIEQRMITKMLENAQKKVESHHFDSRKHLLNYDDILNKQRHVIYEKRREVLGLAGEHKEEKRPMKHTILEMIEQELEFVVSYHTTPQQVKEGEAADEGWNVKEVYETVKTIFPLTQEDRTYVLSKTDKKDGKFDQVKEREEMVAYLMERAKEAYTGVEEEVAKTVQPEVDVEELLSTIEKQIMLRSIDTLWVDHLVQMTYLRTGIGLQGYGQRDPLVEYKRESFHLFTQLQQSIQKEIVYSFFKIGIGLQLAPSIMADDKLVMKGAEKTSEDAAAAAGIGPAKAKKQKMSKKERRKLKRDEKDQ